MAGAWYKCERTRTGFGERLAVLGPNGAGKTTLLRLIAALENPSSGTIAIDGELTVAADAEFRRRVGYATQRAGLLSTTVTKNVELPLRWRGVSRPERRATALASLERLGVAHLAERPAFALSGGEAQRVSLARALAVNPSVLLLDQPAAGLDAPTRESFPTTSRGRLSSARPPSCTCPTASRRCYGSPTAWRCSLTAPCSSSASRATSWVSLLQQPSPGWLATTTSSPLKSIETGRS